MTGRRTLTKTGGVCQDCDQRIVYVVMTATGRRVPIDPIPVEDGNVCVRRIPGKALVGYVISKERPPEPGYQRFAAHFGTCPDRPRPGRSGNSETKKQAPAEPPPTLFDTTPSTQEGNTT